MAPTEFVDWRSYLNFLMTFRLLFAEDEQADRARILDDPNFHTFLTEAPEAGWKGLYLNGQQASFRKPTIQHFAALATQIQSTRLRWQFCSSADVDQLYDAYLTGEASLLDWMNTNLSTLYVEIRNDSCSPPGEEFAMLAFYAGLLANLERTYDVVVNERSYEFWCSVYCVSDTVPLDGQVGGQRLVDILSTLLETSEAGLAARQLGEQRYLAPLNQRLRDMKSPAEEARELFLDAGEGDKGLLALASRYGLAQSQNDWK